MDELLRRLRQAGAPEDDGALTVDHARALATLGRFQLPSPHHYVLMLIAACIGRGASAVDVRCSRRRVTIESDASLGGLFSKSMVGAMLGTDDAAHDFAVGMNAAMALPDGAVSLTTDGPVSDIFPAGARTCRLVIEREGGLLTQPERALIRRHCMHAPVAVRLDGAFIGPIRIEAHLRRFLSAPSFASVGVRVMQSVLDGTYGVGLPEGVAPYEAGAHHYTHGTAEVFYERCFAAIRLDRHDVQPKHCEVRVVHNGVVVACTDLHGRPVVSRDRAASLAIVSSWGLTRDLSRFDVVRDAAFSSRLEWLLEAFRKLQRDTGVLHPDPTQPGGGIWIKE